MKTPSKEALKKIRKDAWVCLKLTIIFGIFFTLINRAFTLKDAGLVFLFSGLYSFVLGLGNGIINDYLNTKWDWVTQTNQRVWSGVITTVLFTVVAVLLIHYVQYFVILNNNIEHFLKGQFLWMHLFIIILSLGIATFFHARGFMVNWKASLKQETTQHEIVAKTETAKFETLKSQIDPHFLFNSLNVLTSLISENPKQAERFTTKLSKVYRYVLEQRNKELVPIEEESTARVAPLSRPLSSEPRPPARLFSRRPSTSAKPLVLPWSLLRLAL